MGFSVTAIPVTFVCGALATAMTAGALTGPSLALAPLVSGMVVNGVVIDTAAIIAGTALATKASYVAQTLMKKYPENFMSKTGLIMGGRRYIVIEGGLSEPLTINDVSKGKHKKFDAKSMK